MRVAIASDHAGWPLKHHLVPLLRREGHHVVDLGTADPSVPSDYPDAAAVVASAVVSGEAERGIVACGSGVGASIAANKVRGVRAGLCHDAYSAAQGVEHDGMNVLVLGARVVGHAVAEDLAGRFLRARYSAEPRHERRLRKVLAIEADGVATGPRTLV